jgi:hypothetical protein
MSSATLVVTKLKALELELVHLAEILIHSQDRQKDEARMIAESLTRAVRLVTGLSTSLQVGDV